MQFVLRAHAVQAASAASDGVPVKVYEADIESEAKRIRFWGKVQIADGCWEWQGSRAPKGYGRFSLGGYGRYEQAHRFAWILAHGQIPNQLHVLHRCDNPPCCNPEHLFLGTNAENYADRVRKGRDGASFRPGDLCRTAKLKWRQVEEIRALWASGQASKREIASRFGVRPSTVHKIIIGETWAQESA